MLKKKVNYVTQYTSSFEEKFMCKNIIPECRKELTGEKEPYSDAWTICGTTNRADYQKLNFFPREGCYEKLIRSKKELWEMRNIMAKIVNAIDGMKDNTKKISQSTKD